MVSFTLGEGRWEAKEATNKGAMLEKNLNLKN
jgi:hypothetical protein